MALEIERRFLIASEGWRSVASKSRPLRQAYLAASADGVTVRVRLAGEDQAWLTLKAAADRSGLVRHEFEYAIPVKDAEALWSLAPHRLVKSRHVLDLDGGDWVVDCFEAGNAPLLIAEVELPQWTALFVSRTGAARRSPAMAAGPMRSWRIIRCSSGLLQIVAASAFPESQFRLLCL